MVKVMEKSHGPVRRVEVEQRLFCMHRHWRRRYRYAAICSGLVGRVDWYARQMDEAISGVGCYVYDQDWTVDCLRKQCE